MNNHRILSGYELVAKGATKIVTTLPELGIKEVFPNRTWLEDKQIQAAIEARKRLIEVERIDKRGVLNHAEWREELKLAEVTRNVGSYWQYLGHNEGKKLYLNPEEALFLLETSCLCLKHNGVIVSLQQAYTLLLRDKITLLQYKVYASLSRVGYRVYRHNTQEDSTCESKINSQRIENDKQIVGSKQVEVKSLENTNDDENCSQNISVSNTGPTEASDVIQIKQETIDEDSIIKVAVQDEQTTHSGNIKHKKVCSLKILQNLRNRQLKPCNNEILHKYFDNVPELLENNIIPVKAPDKSLIPFTINLTKPVYNINLLNIKKKEKSAQPSPTETNIYSANDEVNGSHIRRLSTTSNKTESSLIPPDTTTGFATQQNTQYHTHRSSHYWRTRQPFNYYNYNMLYQRPILPVWYFGSNFSFYPRTQQHFWRPNFFNNYRNYHRKGRTTNTRTRKDIKKQHLDGILKLATRLKQLMLAGNTTEQNIYALQRLIQTYNTKYKTKVRLNERFEIVFDENILDTITLEDDDEGPSSKRLKPNPVFEDNLNSLKGIALRLKELECKEKSSGKYRRAFSKLLKTFNESYKEDYYLNDEYELTCRNQIDLDTSESDLDGITEDTPIISGKKLKNPFNVLKRLSETVNSPPAEVTTNSNDNLVAGTNKKYSDLTLNTFTKDWLPREDDFGRADIISNDACINVATDIRREEFLYDFIKIQKCKYNNWLDLKKSFFYGIQAAILEFQDNLPTRAKMKINSIVNPEDCADMASVLKKLSIIKSDKRLLDECKLSIDFDVYNRDVQNFRKSNRPTPHFRVICLNESTNLPPGEEIAALHAKYTDQVAIVFAVVGIDSISYVRINPTDLPVHISNAA